MEDLTDRLRRQQEESDRLRDVIKARDAELQQQSSKDSSLGVAVAESQGELGTVQYEVVRLQREKELLERQVEIQQTDLASRSSDLSRQKLMAAEAQQQIQQHMQEIVQERDELTDTVTRLKLADQEKDSKVSNLEFQLSELKLTMTEAAETAAKELRKAEEKAVLHKEHFDKAATELQELEEKSRATKPV